MNETSKAFGEQVKRFRTLAGMTQMQLADAVTRSGARLTHVMIAKIEGGTRPTTVPELIALAQALTITPASLLPEGSVAARSGDEVMAAAGRRAAVTALEDAIATLEGERRKLSRTTCTHEQTCVHW